MSKTHSKSQQKSETMTNNSSQDSGMLNTLFLFQSVYLGGKLWDYKLSEMCCWKLKSAGMVTSILCKRERMDIFSQPPCRSLPVWDSRVDPLH